MSKKCLSMKVWLKIHCNSCGVAGASQSQRLYRVYYPAEQTGFHIIFNKSPLRSSGMHFINRARRDSQQFLRPDTFKAAHLLKAFERQKFKLERLYCINTGISFEVVKIDASQMPQLVENFDFFNFKNIKTSFYQQIDPQLSNNWKQFSS